MSISFIRRALGVLGMLCAVGAPAQQNINLCSEKPRLVLIIIVDNINNEQLDIVRSRCGRDGINRLYNYGTQICGAHYDAGGNYSGKNMATLFTGAPAATHGIVGRSWIDHFSNKKTDAIYGDRLDRAGNPDTLALPSNSQLLCSTIGNEIRKIYGNQSKVMSVGFDAEMLQWASGSKVQEPVACFDVRTGQMRPQNITDSLTLDWIANFNSKRMADNYLTNVWAPSNDIVEYHEWRYFGGNADAKRKFYYPMQASPGQSKYQKIKGSPFGNTLIRDFAASALLCSDMGKDDIPDVLTVQFSATPSCGSKRQPLDAETEDLMLTLDSNIASLLKVIDHSIGMESTLVLFTAAQGCYDVANTMNEHWDIQGVVSLKRTSALLNLYLMALYGQEQWVSNYGSCEIYLNKELAAKRKVDWNQMLSSAADFLLQVKGIGNAVVAKDLTDIYSVSPVIDVMRRNYHPKRSGHILLSLEPGWAEELDDGTVLTQLWGQEFVPLVFYGWKVPRATIYERHNMADVAPTICSYIRVAPPNGCSGTPIPVVRHADLNN